MISFWYMPLVSFKSVPLFEMLGSSKNWEEYCPMKAPSSKNIGEPQILSASQLGPAPETQGENLNWFKSGQSSNEIPRPESMRWQQLFRCWSPRNILAGSFSARNTLAQFPLYLKSAAVPLA